jgi:hypothetical protein
LQDFAASDAGEQFVFMDELEKMISYVEDQGRMQRAVRRTLGWPLARLLFPY